VLRLLLSFTILLILPNAQSDEPWRVSGFLTQGINLTSDYYYLGDSDDRISTDFTEAGINISRFISNQVSFTTQITYRNSNPLDEDDFFLDILQIDYRFHQTDNSQSGIKIGRIKHKLRLYDDVYDIASTWETALLPEATYPQRTRSALISFDGLKLHQAYDSGSRLYEINLGAGKKKIKKRILEDVYLYNIGGSEDTNTDEVYSFLVETSNHTQTQRIGFSYLYARWSPDTNFFQTVDAEIDSKNKFYNFYISQSWGLWSLEAEHVRQSQINKVKNVQFPEGPGSCSLFCQSSLSVISQLVGQLDDSRAYYLSLHHHRPNGLKFYVSYGQSYTFDNDKRGKKLENKFGIPGHTTYLKQTTLGIHYNLNKNLSISGEVSQFEGTKNLSSKLNAETLAKNKYWQSLFLRISYSF
jgi:hypothetical protein